MVNYNVDMPTQWFRQIRTARYFDAMICAQPDNMQNLKKYSKKVFYFPMAAQQPQLNIASKLEKNHDVTFLGTAIPVRRYFLSKLVKYSVALSIYGKYWDSIQSDSCIRSIQKTLFDIGHYG